jgi:hypothetical protein
MASLGEEYPKQQARVREILGHYKEIGPAGAFGAAWIEALLRRADTAAVEQNLPNMIACYQEMQEVKE